MRGYLISSEATQREPSGSRPLAGWEERAIDAVGTVIEFWGFKRNQGRVWALLYLRGEARTAAEIQEDLGLSKGAVSMITHELERWGVIQRARSPGVDAWRFLAEQNLMEMISRVLAEREVGLVSRVKEDLLQAEREAKSDPRATREQLTRIGRMRLIADLVERSLSLFLKTARLDATRVVGVLGALRGQARRVR
jgi:HTH-type transcriptional regulator, glycine betaine synthesis regulator